MRISGFVIGEYLWTEQESDEFDNFGTRGRFRINVDVRQPTEYGLLRGFIRLDGRRNTGAYVSGGEAPGGVTTDVARYPDQAYIQFGGLTAGRSQSFFDFYTAPDVLAGGQIGASDVKNQVLAYTFSFGGGFSGTIAIEDSLERRVFAGPLDPGFIADPGFVFPLEFAPQGQEWPDLIGNLRIDQAWGAAQVMGALHHLNPLNTGPFVDNLALSRADDELGWAVGAGVMFKLPFIAPGDELWLQAVYAEGASSYAGVPSGTQRFTTVRVPVTDAFIDRFGNVETSESFSVSGKFLHYWLPNLRSNIFASYTTIDFGGDASRLVELDDASGRLVRAGFVGLDVWEVGANLIWTPVRQLDIGVETIYRKFESDGPIVNEFAGRRFDFEGGAIDPDRFRLVDNDDAIEVRLRVQRDF